MPTALGAALWLDVGDEGLALRLFDGVEQAVSRERGNDLPGAAGKDEPDIDQAVDALAQHRDGAAADAVPQQAHQWRRDDAGGVEQRIQQDHLRDAEACTVGAQRQAGCPTAAANARFMPWRVTAFRPWPR